MHYIVTGSEGFIGKNLVERLEKDGHTVSPYDIKIEKDLYSLTPEVFDLADGVFHLACINQEVAERELKENWRVNALSARWLAEKCALEQIPLIYTSTCSVYGNADSFPTSVKDYPAAKTRYAFAKYVGEVFILNSDCDTKIFRLSNVYGPHQTTENPYCGVIGKFLEAKLFDRPLEIIRPGTQTRDFTYVDDVIDALVNYEKAPNLINNVAYGREITIWELANLISPNTTLINPRSVDSIKRRWIWSDIECKTGLEEGLNKTLEWMHASLSATRSGS